MKANVCHRYGAPEALRCEDVDKPTPGEQGGPDPGPGRIIERQRLGSHEGPACDHSIVPWPAQALGGPTRSRRGGASRVHGPKRDPVQTRRRHLWAMPRIPGRVCVCLGIVPGREASERFVRGGGRGSACRAHRPAGPPRQADPARTLLTRATPLSIIAANRRGGSSCPPDLREDSARRSA